MHKKKVLIFDIETAPHVAYVWGRKDVNIALNQLKRESSVIAWAAKWLDAPASETLYSDARRSRDIANDRALLKPLWKLLDEADIVITQNGKNFDSKVLNARFITHGMPPPSPYRHLDTYQIARGVAKFTSNGLDYLTEKLCTRYKKLSHDKFPGMSLWTECLAGNTKAWDEMRRYNIHDVLSTEELYTKLRAWAPQSAPSVHLEGCGVCGSKDLVRQGHQYSRGGRTPQYSCRSCNAWSRGKRVPL